AVLLEERPPAGADRDVAAVGEEAARARVRRVMEEDELPLARRGGEIGLEPAALRGVAAAVAVEHGEVRVAVVEGVEALGLRAIARLEERLRSEERRVGKERGAGGGP